jgi:hypothetical protein
VIDRRWEETKASQAEHEALDSWHHIQTGSGSHLKGSKEEIGREGGRKEVKRGMKVRR